MGKFNYALLTVALLAMSLFSGLIVIQVYGQSDGAEPTTSDNIVGLVVAVGGIISAISAIIVAVINRSGYKKGDNQLIDQVLNTATGLKGTDQEILALRDDLTTVISVMTNISPEIKAELERRGMDIKTARERAEELRAEIEMLYPVVNR